MKRLFIALVVFVTAVGAGSLGGYRVRAMINGTPTPADSASRRSGADSAAADSSRHAPAQPDSSVPTKPPVLAAPTPTVTAVPLSLDTSRLSAAARSATRDSAVADSIARARWTGALAKMPPANAAKMLATLSDDEASLALATIPERQLAQILAAMAPDRASAVMRRAVRTDPRTGRTP
jgi:hypothetical protein